MLTRIKHVGVRPTHYPLTVDESQSNKRRNIIYYEMIPGGGFKIWNNRTLSSGCGLVIEDATINDTNKDLIWCPHCKEWANYNQFITDTGDENVES